MQKERCLVINTQRLTDSFMDYVRIDSLSGQEGNMARRLTAELEELGLEVYVDNAGEAFGGEVGNIIATLPATGPGEPIALCAHMDTVKPGEGIRPVLEDGVIYSAGDTVLGADDKSGVAAIIEGLRVVKENNIAHPMVQVVFTVSEEAGLRGSRYMDYSKLTAKKAAVMDSGRLGVIVTAGPGQYKIRAVVHGKRAHAGGAPQNGISSIQALCEAISNMKQLRIDPETTANIGYIHSDFPTNVVADRAEMLAECRSRDPEKLEKQAKHMEDCLKLACEKYGATLELDRTRSYHSYSHDPEHPFIAEMAECMQRVGQEPKLVPGGGGSDVNNMVRHGITALMIGTGMQKVHTVQECIPVADMVSAAELVVELVRSK